MDYKVLSQEEQDEIVVNFLLAQERDLFCHQINLDRYNKMLETLPDGKWKEHVSNLRAETASRINEVKSILDATESQLPSAERLQAAKIRIAQKQQPSA